jgi:hypothetical protein
MHGRRWVMRDDLTVQATIQFKIHKWGFMNDKIGTFADATDKELLDYCIDGFEGYCRSIDGDAIEVSIIRPVQS